MKSALLIFALNLFTAQAYSMSCKSILNQKMSLVERVFDGDRVENETEYTYLIMLLNFTLSPKIANYTAKKFGYEEAIGFKAKGEDVIRIMVRLLNHMYTSIPIEVLEMGKEALLSKTDQSRSPEEAAALALIEVHLSKFYSRNKGNEQELVTRGLNTGIELLEAHSEPRTMWHLAEFYYKKKSFQKALDILSSLTEQQNLGPESKVQEAVDAVKAAQEGVVYLNLVEISSFDSTQWGPYAPKSKEDMNIGRG